jgi:peptidoglycan/xylan/chitin deacetylase (PgdA/CDA1 family)
MLPMPVALAQAETAPTTPLLAASAPRSHATSEEADGIRFHRMRRLDAKLSTEYDAARIQRESCRYESSIAVVPPPQRVALTFDDGPEPGQTEHILAVLRRHAVPATFFMIGEKAQRHPELVAAVHAEGVHHIGNHSWSHPNFHAISAEQQRKELQDTDLALRAAMGMKLFRYPYGNSTCETNRLLKSEGYATVGWHVDSCDWAFERTGTVDTREAMECSVLPQYHSHYVEHVVSAVRAHNGGVILMHEIHPNTVRQLEDIISRLEAEGFKFGALDEEVFAPSLWR